MPSKPLRTLLIGDIHGCYKELKELLAHVNFNPSTDRLIALGDLVHKGPKSSKVLKFFFKNKHEVIMGNHDFHFLKSLKGQCKSYPEAERILAQVSIPKKALVKWMEGWPYFIEGDNFIAVHAAFDPSKKSYKSTSKEDMISGRYFSLKSKRMVSNIRKRSPEIKPWYHLYNPAKLNHKITVFGHWAQPLPRTYKNFRCLDSGCCYGGHLSCLILPDDKLYQVASKQPKKFNY